MFASLALPLLALASLASAAPAPVSEKRNTVYPTARRPPSESMADFQTAFTLTCNDWAPFHQPGFYYTVEVNTFTPGGRKGGADPEDLAVVGCVSGDHGCLEGR